VQTADGGFLLVGDGQCYSSPQSPLKRQITVAKVDVSGQREWMTNVGTVGWNYGKNGVELADGTFLVAGVLSEGSAQAYAERRALIRLAATGEVLHTQTFPSLQPGLLDGLMGLTAAGPHAVAATGYVRARQTYTDEPMFLITGGHAILMKLAIPNCTTADLPLLFETVFDSPLAAANFTAFQGMRLVADSRGYTISAASYLPSEGNTNFGLVRTDTAGRVVGSAYLPPADGYASHPYAFTAGSDGGYVIAGHTIRTSNDTPEGRIVKVSASLQLEFDVSFLQERKGYSTECYGVDACPDGGYIVACGTGPEINQGSEPWQNLVQRVDRRGAKLWKKVYTGGRGRNGTGEFVVTDRVRGGYAVYMDTQDWGDGSTGGNFAIMHLDSDTDTARAVGA